MENEWLYDGFWGFQDSRTAELMMARAKKLKYNAEKRKKFEN